MEWGQPVDSDPSDRVERGLERIVGHRRDSNIRADSQLLLPSGSANFLRGDHLGRSAHLCSWGRGCNSDSNSDSNSDTDTDSNADTDSNTDTDSNADTDSNTDSNGTRAGATSREFQGRALCRPLQLADAGLDGRQGGDGNHLVHGRIHHFTW